MNESLKEIEKEKKKKTNQKAIKTGINRIISSIKNFYSSIKSSLEQLDWEIKRRIIKALIGRIDIGHDQVEIGFQIEEPAEDGKISNLYHCTTYHNKGAGEGCQVVFCFYWMTADNVHAVIRLTLEPMETTLMTWQAINKAVNSAQKCV